VPWLRGAGVTQLPRPLVPNRTTSMSFALVASPTFVLVSSVIHPAPVIEAPSSRLGVVLQDHRQKSGLPTFLRPDGP
jgi:hypothetical protein